MKLESDIRQEVRRWPGEPAPVMPDPWEPLREAVANTAAECGETQSRHFDAIEEPLVRQPVAPDCDCLACASDMAGIYPCLIEDEQ